MIWRGRTGYDVGWHGVIWHVMIMWDMTWHDMIWYEVIWYNVTWYDMMWHGLLFHEIGWHDTTRYGVVWNGMVWHDATWHDMTSHNMISYHMMWIDMICRCVHIYYVYEFMHVHMSCIMCSESFVILSYILPYSCETDVEEWVSICSHLGCMLQPFADTLQLLQLLSRVRGFGV